jgi:clan AA aspartic protease
MAMRGRVTADAREAVIALEVLGAHGDRAEIEAVIDTGFTGFLTLPADLVRSLSLPLRGSRDVVLADGSVVGLDVYRGRVVWHDQALPVAVLESEGGPLVGMALLRGSELRLRAVDGDDVLIEELP